MNMKSPEQELDYKIVNHGPDTFLVNYKYADEHGTLTGEKLPDDIIEQLDDWQREARRNHEDVLTSLVFGYVVGETSYEQPLFIRSHGSSTWSWLLHCDDIKVNFAPGTLNKGLFCQVRFSSHLLHILGPERAIIEAESMLYDFLHDAFHKQASEVHLCVDVQGFDFASINPTVGGQLPFVSRVTDIHDRPIPPLEEEQEGGLSAQAISELETKIEQEIACVEQEQHEVFTLASVLTAHRRIATIDFGSHASDISAQIYNKSLEVKKHRKEWFYDIWRDHGWDGVSTIWRVEFRFKRAFLRRYELDEAFTVVELFHLLWKYATEQWLRFVDLDAAHGVNVSRLPTHPVWLLIQHAYDDVEQETQGRERGLSRESWIKYMLREKPLEVLKQAELLRLSDAAQETLDQCLYSVPFLYEMLNKSVLDQMQAEGTAIEYTLRGAAPEGLRDLVQEQYGITGDVPLSVVREIAQTSLAQLSTKQLGRLMNRFALVSLEEVRTVLVKQEKKMAKRQACIAQALGNIRSAVALMPVDELPGYLGPGCPGGRELPDLLSSMVWFIGNARDYDKKKGRNHIEEVYKKQLKYGFERAIQHRREQREHGVVLPVDPLSRDDLCSDDWLAIYQALDSMRASARRDADNNTFADEA